MSWFKSKNSKRIDALTLKVEELEATVKSLENAKRKRNNKRNRQA